MEYHREIHIKEFHNYRSDAGGAFQLGWSKLDTVVIYQLQQEVAEVGPHSVRLWSISVRKVNQVQEQALVDVKVLRVKKIQLRSIEALCLYHEINVQ